jgi:transcriptional regulator with XRE-family HTH domain
MRNAESDDWATLVKAGRIMAKLSQAAFGAAVGVARETVWRWETGKQKPENAEVVARVAKVIGEDEQRLLRAARLALTPGDAPKVDPRLRGLDPNDTVVKRILALDISEELRDRAFERHRRKLADRERQDLEELEFLAQREQGAA